MAHKVGQRSSLKTDTRRGSHDKSKQAGPGCKKKKPPSLKNQIRAIERLMKKVTSQHLIEKASLPCTAPCRRQGGEYLG